VPLGETARGAEGFGSVFAKPRAVLRGAADCSARTTAIVSDSRERIGALSVSLRAESCLRAIAAEAKANVIASSGGRCSLTPAEPAAEAACANADGADNHGRPRRGSLCTGQLRHLTREIELLGRGRLQPTTPPLRFHCGVRAVCSWEVDAHAGPDPQLFEEPEDAGHAAGRSAARACGAAAVELPRGGRRGAGSTCAGGGEGGARARP
jgi:hypothetical protein